MTAVRACTQARRMLAIELRQALADARAAAPALREQVQPLLRAPRVGVVQRLRHRGDAGVEDEAVHVGQLGAERARQAQVEEAVRRHRAADVDQQHQPRAHAAAVAPRQVERRAAAGHAAADRAPAGPAAGRGARALRGAAGCGLSWRAKRRISASMSQRVLALRSGRGSRWSASTSSRLAASRGGVVAGRRPLGRRRGLPPPSGCRPRVAHGMRASRRCGCCQRLAGRNQASNSSSKRRHSSPRPHSSACRLQRSTPRIEHADALRGRAARAPRRAPPTREAVGAQEAGKPPRRARRSGGDRVAGCGPRALQHARRQSRDDLAREAPRGRRGS